VRGNNLSQDRSFGEIQGCDFLIFLKKLSKNNFNSWLYFSLKMDEKGLANVSMF
jgi:hypothetical protein